MPWRTEAGAGPSPPGCERVRDRIDPYLEEELSRPEAEELGAHLAECPDCRADLALARRLQEAMQEGLPMLACPPEVTARVLAVALEEARGQGEAPRPTLRRWWAWLGEGAPRPLRPLWAAVAVLLLLVAAPLLYRSMMPPPAGEAPEVAAGEGEARFSAAEIARAEEEARLVLAYVATVGLDAGRAVQEEVFTDGIGRPARRLIEGLEAAGLGREPSPPAPSETPRERRSQ